MRDIYRDRLSLVVGASEGIGHAVAAALVARGSRVVLTGRRPEPLEAACRAMGALDVRAFDVAQWMQVETAIQELCATVGVPDLVVNCAGLAYPEWLHEADVSHIEEMMRINYLGTVHVCKAVLPPMLARGAGRIVNTASLGGLLGLYGYSGYCGSKFAVIGFSEALRREVGPRGIRVQVLCPPNTRTPGLERENRHKPAEVLAQEESVATVEPEQVAAALLRAIPGGRATIIPTFDGRAAWLLARWAPWLLDRILRRRSGPS